MSPLIKFYKPHNNILHTFSYASQLESASQKTSFYIISKRQEKNSKERGQGALS